MFFVSSDTSLTVFCSEDYSGLNLDDEVMDDYQSSLSLHRKLKQASQVNPTRVTTFLFSRLHCYHLVAMTTADHLLLAGRRGAADDSWPRAARRVGA